MKKVGLTGGIGSGKSTLARMLGEEGFTVVDADQIAREIMEPGSPVLDQVAEVFGADLIDDSGVLNRGELAKRAFSSKEQTSKLNALTHPAIRAESNRRFAEAEAAGAPAVIYDMPLLVDLGLHNDMDITVVVDVDVDERVRRLVDKRGLAEADARARIAQQIDDDTRLAAADIVVDNNGPLEDLAPQVDKVVALINA